MLAISTFVLGAALLGTHAPSTPDVARIVPQGAVPALRDPFAQPPATATASVPRASLVGSRTALVDPFANIDHPRSAEVREISGDLVHPFGLPETGARRPRPPSALRDPFA
jgi:hypothetical protein